MAGPGAVDEFGRPAMFAVVTGGFQATQLVAVAPGAGFVAAGTVDARSVGRRHSASPVVAAHVL
jgi:hypothetical protein